MIASVMTWCLVAALGQAPGVSEEAAWLEAVPADADVVVRLRGIAPVRNNLVAMLEAMSPTAAAQVKPALERGLERIRTALGEDVVPVDAPVLSVLRLPRPGPPPAAQGPSSAIFIRTKDYEALHRAIAGQGREPRPEAKPGGYEALAGKDGHPLFTTRGDGFAVVSNDEELIRAIARPEAALGRELAPELRDLLLRGDAGLYVNLAALGTLYRDQLQQLRQSFLGGIERGAAGAGGAEIGRMARSLYGGWFDALHDSRALVLNAEMGADGLVLTGRIAPMPDSPTARRLAVAKTGTADLLARLPGDATFFLAMTVDPATFESLQAVGLSYLGGAGGEPSADVQKALRLQREAGPREVASASTYGRGGVKTLNLMTFDDPRKATEAIDQMIRAMKAPGVSWITDLALEPGARSSFGFSLSRATMTLDLDKLAALQPNTPGGASALKTMLGTTLSTWYGTDGKLVLSVTAKDWEQARAMIEVATTNLGSLGQIDGFRAVRSRLPERLGGAFLLNSQGLVQQMVAQLSAIAPNNPDLTPPLALNLEPALFGGSLSPATDGYQFHLVVPAAVGPVIELGLFPLFPGIGGKASR